MDLADSCDGRGARASASRFASCARDMNTESLELLCRTVRGYNGMHGDVSGSCITLANSSNEHVNKRNGIRASKNDVRNKLVQREQELVARDIWTPIR